MTHQSKTFDAFNKLAAAAAMQSTEASRSSTVGDSMKTFRGQSRSTSQWTSPNPTQATPNDNPIAAQKMTPPPPVQ